MRKYFAGALIILFLVIGFSIETLSGVDNIDYRILRYIEKTRTDERSTFFRFVSDINNPLCIAVILVLLVSRWIKKEKEYYYKAFFVAQSIIFSQAITFSFKALYGRLRPQLYDPTFISVISATNKSFPSGHTSEAVATALAVSMVVPKWWVRLLAFSWAALIAYSRMYLGVHYPSDVLGGAIVGISGVWITVALRKWIRKRNKKSQPPIPNAE